MSPASSLVIKYLKEHGPRTLDEICTLLPEEGRQKVRKRLDNLKCLGWLHNELDLDGLRRYRINTSQRTRKPRVDPANDASEIVEAELLPIVPPRRIDVMNSTWTPQPDPVLRPGANDYRAIPSHGHGC